MRSFLVLVWGFRWMTLFGALHLPLPVIALTVDVLRAVVTTIWGLVSDVLIWWWWRDLVSYAGNSLDSNVAMHVRGRRTALPLMPGVALMTPSARFKIGVSFYADLHEKAKLAPPASVEIQVFLLVTLLHFCPFSRVFPCPHPKGACGPAGLLTATWPVTFTSRSHK